jgi:hypothetical protein
MLDVLQRDALFFKCVFMSLPHQMFKGSTTNSLQCGHRALFGHKTPRQTPKHDPDLAKRCKSLISKVSKHRQIGQLSAITREGIIVEEKIQNYVRIYHLSTN